MSEVVQPKGLAKPDLNQADIARLLARLREAGAQGPVMDLTKQEPDPTSDRADVYFDDDDFEKKLEVIKVKVRVAKLAEVSTEVHTAPLSPVSIAATAFLLAAAGCLYGLVSHAIDAPEWAQLGGLLVPWAMALSWAMFGRLRAGAASLPTGEAGPAPDRFCAERRAGTGPGRNLALVQGTSDVGRRRRCGWTRYLFAENPVGVNRGSRLYIR